VKYFLSLLFVSLTLTVFPQIKQPDSVKNLEEVTITNSGFTTPYFLRATGSALFIGNEQLQNQQQSSLVGVLNTASGVRMEERSPGSYRLSLRGSLLRSPFGIRNVKIYVDDFPLTDAGGNTYLNLIDARSVNSLAILKGPQASAFGANTGGAILINSTHERESERIASLTVGSYGLFHQTAKVEQIFKNYRFSFNQGYQQSDGYRENSALKRKYFQTSHQWNYNQKAALQAFVIYSDLAYQTPGGLTDSQMLENPAAARPATPTLPSASVQRAGIENKTFFGGLSHTYYFNHDLQYVITLFGNTTDFKNPFITNYEKRNEHTLGLRSAIHYRNDKDINRKYEVYLGFEGARTASHIENYGNDKGIATALKANDELTAKQSFAFLRANIDLSNRFLMEIGASLNFFGYAYQSYFPIAVAEQDRDFKTALMPKFAFSYLFNQDLSIRASVSKGYSPPTIAEVRASDNVINTRLRAEAGWNYETGLYYRTRDQRLTIDGGLFYFQLKNAIVRRLTAIDAEYFINAGGTKQLGTEVQVSWLLIKPNDKRVFDGLRFTSSYTYSHFRFEDFKNASVDLSGNKLTGVPDQTVVSSLTFTFLKGIYLFVQHNYTSSIPLDDANTVYSKRYHLADLKMGIRNWDLGKVKLDLSFGVNNVFDQQYSLGNDLNAANNRYYNPAAGINYYTGVAVRF
jgi:iron complex outermembrane receptor protein